MFPQNNQKPLKLPADVCWRLGLEMSKNVNIYNTETLTAVLPIGADQIT